MTEVPIDFDLEDIKSQHKYNKEELKKLFFKLQMKSLLNKLPGSDDEVEAQEEEEVEDIFIIKVFHVTLGTFKVECKICRND